MTDYRFAHGCLSMENGRVTLHNYIPSRTSGPTTSDNARKKKRFIFTDDEEGARAMRKMKRVITENNEYGLRVMIMQANGIDNPMLLHPPIQNRLYRVVCWVDPCGEILCTSLKEGLICLQWMDEGIIPLENTYDHAFLHVEIMRFSSKDDPGTSHGMVVVGRARIPFPKVPDFEIKGNFELVRTRQGEEPKPEGSIMVSMTLETMKPERGSNNSYCF